MVISSFVIASYMIVLAGLILASIFAPESIFLGNELDVVFTAILSMMMIFSLSPIVVLLCVLFIPFCGIYKLARYNLSSNKRKRN